VKNINRKKERRKQTKKKEGRWEERKET